jgi:hypothetical protein
LGGVDVESVSSTLPAGGTLTFTIRFSRIESSSPLQKLVESGKGYVAQGAAWLASLAERAYDAATSWLNVSFASYRLSAVQNGIVDMEQFFAKFKKTSADTASLDQSVFEDTGLEADTVYLYRVRACYGTACTPWGSEAATKTLPAGATPTSGKTGICTRNSLCEQRAKYSGGGAASENQCTSNGQCRDVGTSRQFFEETPGR